MAKIYTEEEIAAIHARGQGVEDKVYKTANATYQGTKSGRLTDISNALNIANTETTADANTITGAENATKIEKNLSLIRDLQTQVTQVSNPGTTPGTTPEVTKCYVVAMSIIL